MADEKLSRVVGITCPRCHQPAAVYLGAILPHKTRIRGWGHDGQGRKVPIDIVVECNADGVTLENPT